MCLYLIILKSEICIAITLSIIAVSVFLFSLFLCLFFFSFFLIISLNAKNTNKLYIIQERGMRCTIFAKISAKSLALWNICLKKGHDEECDELLQPNQLYNMREVVEEIPKSHNRITLYYWNIGGHFLMLLTS